MDPYCRMGKKRQHLQKQKKGTQDGRMDGVGGSGEHAGNGRNLAEALETAEVLVLHGDGPLDRENQYR